MSIDRLDSWEWVESRDPLRIARRIKWTECDPAGVAYTGRFPDFLLSSVDLYMNQLYGEPMSHFHQRHRFGTPVLSLNLDFRHPISPDEVIVITPYISDIADKHFTVSIEADGRDGKRRFTGSVKLICISSEVRKAISIPDVLRITLQDQIERRSVDPETRL